MLQHLVAAADQASPLRPSVAHGPSSTPGTADNPLIPKRRRRTTPVELAILEEEFVKNPLPSQAERALIAPRVSMSGRALQVWFQNRRQKEKRADSSYPSSVSSVTDADEHSSDFEAFSSSSMPACSPPPSLPFATSTCTPHSQSSSSIDRKISPLSNVGSSSIVPPDASVVAANDVCSAGVSQSAVAAIALSTSQSLPSSGAASAPVQDKDVKPDIYLHRPFDANGIAAKKHVKKRPLGTNAPLARTPALPHAFVFPPSPRRSAAAPFKLQETDGNIAKREASVGLSAPFAPAPGLKRRSSALFTNEVGQAKLEDIAPSGATLKPEDVWQHMQSDPPSAHSPAPLTRRRVRDLVAGMQSSPVQPPTPNVYAARPPVTRTLSLGGMSASSAFTAALERSRAGGEEACAEMALERKRLRMAPQPAKPKVARRARASKPKLSGAAIVAAGNAARKGRRPASRSPSAASESSMAELSFSSTSTASTAVSVGTPLDQPLAFGEGYFDRKASEMDNDRACAELLLGLGGFVGN